MNSVVKKKFSKELNESLIEYLDLWACNYNWKLYKKEYFPINALYYYKYAQYPFVKELNPEKCNKKRNDFIYGQMDEIGGFISHLQEIFSDYSIYDNWNKERFLKKIVSDNKRKKSFKNFLKQIVKQAISYDRTIFLHERIEQSDTDEKIYYISKIYKDFCRIHEFLNSQFDHTVPINPRVKSRAISGTLPQTVLYHFILIKSGIEKEIDRNAMKEEFLKLAVNYGFTGYKRFSDYFRAIDNNSEEVRNRSTYTYEDAEIVEKALKENYPNRPDVIDNLYNKTHPIYP